MLWLLWKLYHNWVASRKTRKHSFLKRGKQSRGNPMQKVLWPIRRVRFTVYATSSEYPGKERTIVGKNKCQSSSSAKSLRSENWGPVTWRDRKTAAMCRKQGLESCQKHIQAQSENKATFCSPAEEWVLPAASTKEPEEREFVVDSGASLHTVSKRDFDSA